MPSTVRSSSKKPSGKRPTAAAQRQRKAEERAAQARRAVRQRWLRWGAVVAAVLVVVAGGIYLITRDGDPAGPGGASSGGWPVVGGDLHTVATIGDALFVGGHAAVAVSHDGGRQWQQVASLEDADAMGWALTSDAILAGGHPGLYRSTDKGATFTKVTGAAAVPDVHALGGTGSAVYLASPQAGLLASTDGGNSWQVRNPQTGRAFMGTILVDPTNPERLIAPDMSAGLSTSNDGGRTWKPLGGPSRAMAVAWNPTNISQLVTVGMSGAARSSDGGSTWQPIEMPARATAVAYDATGTTIYAGVLNGQRAHTYRSTDNGTTWTTTA